MDLNALIGELREFVRERDWEQFHSPKNLSMALSVEAAELMEHFQWLSREESTNLPPEKKLAVQDEVADVFIYLVRIADVLGIDLLEAAERKLAGNRERYPAEKVRGLAKKASEY